MTKNRDNFDRSVIESLTKRAAFICSNPDCKALTISPSTEDENKFIYIGKVAHITAASEGGPRFDSNLTSVERKAINNGIFLCSNCSDMIDKNNGIDFSVELLKKWKADHESWVSRNLNKKIDKEVGPTQIFNVTSHNQEGGFTAGIVNVRPQPRIMNARVRNQLAQLLSEKSKVVTITCVMGDGEAFNYAAQIKNYLISEGYTVKGVNQTVFSRPVTGQIFDPDKLTITIGTKQ